MTDKELHKLRKSEMIELMYSLRKELDKVSEENALLKKQLNEKDAVFDELLKLNRETAVNVRALCGKHSEESAEETEQ